MKRNKLIMATFVALITAGSTQVMATDQLQTREQLDLECNDCQSIAGDNSTTREQNRDRSFDREHAQNGDQAKKQHRYMKNENSSDYNFQRIEDRESSIADSSNRGSGGGMRGGKGRH